MAGNPMGDIWVGGRDPKRGASVKSLQNKSGILLKSVKVSTCATANGGSDFGIHAGTFSKLTIGAWKLGAGDLPFQEVDFCVSVT